VAVDLPFLTQEFLEYLRSRFEHSTRPLLACKIGSAFPHCLGVWQPMLSDINRCLAARQLSIHGLIEAGSSEIISEEEFRQQGFDPAIFRNINTPEDYRSL